MYMYTCAYVCIYIYTHTHGFEAPAENPKSTSPKQTKHDPSKTKTSRKL